MVKLKSSSSSIGVVVFLLIFGCIWNIGISFFVSDVLDDWAAGRRPWFETLFMIPFVAVGVGVIIGVFYMFLKCFNPKVQVWVSDQTVELGSSFELQWQFKGSTRSIRRFQIQLIGTEWAQYQQGTSTYTDTEEFYCVDLFENEKDEFDSSSEIDSGQLEVQIPAETMHSFKASNNQIKWSLRFIGDIPYWPDIKDEFEFTILPFQGISTSKY